MKKELFIKSVEAIKKQAQHDIELAQHLGKAFPNACEANLLPDNHYLQNALIELLQVAMNDTKLCPDGYSWIEYFCWELDFGNENWRLKVYDRDKNEVAMSTAEELYEFLEKNNK